MEKKKTKLTISGNPRKSIDNIEIARLKNKNSVVIEKKPNRFTNNNSSRRNSDFKPKFKQNSPSNEALITKKTHKTFKQTSQNLNDYEKRKLAEQRATKRLKGSLSEKDSRGKSSKKKRIEINCIKSIK